ncbi:vasodilator-stimulated phosphoprotein-like isoform X4 [Dreissena polymorpha]|uniref:vasodilator-stimulated phosphoprotein-like isoform X4 n=1 Tax=Dreissena polymorpha TaxID=45954 RepID=UPI0022648E55|nr:vasodilator-stimulated phosphoprotein-like isoform X4 [Dreissena polymorpha]
MTTMYPYMAGADSWYQDEEDPYTSPYGEVPICSSRANVMTYDDGSKKWIPCGNAPGLSKVQIYQHTVNNTFRVVGRKLADHEVVINCAILKNLKYNQATPTFHQWRDSRSVYGLNFANKEDSDTFSNAMMTALDILNNQSRPTSGPPQPPMNAPPPSYQQMNYTQQTNGPPAFNDQVEIRPPRQPSGGAPAIYQTYQEPPAPVSAPVAPPVSTIPTPPVVLAAPPFSGPPLPPAGGPPPAPPPPPAGGPPLPPAGRGPPAPPPPPAPPSIEGMGGGGGLAAALAEKANRLKKVSTEPAAPSDSAASGRPPAGGGVANAGRSVGGGGPVDHMAELAKKLQRRKNIENPQEAPSAPPPIRTVSPSPPQERVSGHAAFDKPATNGNKANGMPSPVFPRRGPGSPAFVRRTDSLKGSQVDGAMPPNKTSDEPSAISSSELETLKQEILAEMRKEINQMKQEILDAIRDSAR